MSEHTERCAERPTRDHFTILPNILFEMDLSAHAIALYAALKRSAGERGVCFRSTVTLARDAGMSTGQVCAVKRELERAGLIVIREGKKVGRNHLHEITVTDLWSRNATHFVKGTRSPGERAYSPGEGSCLHDERPCSHGERSKNPIARSREQDHSAASAAESLDGACVEVGPLSECQRAVLEIFDRERFANGAQAREIRRWEAAYGARAVLQAAAWIAGKGVGMQDAFSPMRSALPKWRDRRPGRRDRDGVKAGKRTRKGRAGPPAARERARDRADDEHRSGSRPLADNQAFALPGTDLDARDVWQRGLQELRMQMTQVTFDTWLSGSRVTHLDDDGRIVIAVRDAYVVEWLCTRWCTPIQRTLTGIVGHEVGVEFVVAERGGGLKVEG